MGWPTDSSSFIILKKSVLQLMDHIVYVLQLKKAATETFLKKEKA
jgi:hypothetical protein